MSSSSTWKIRTLCSSRENSAAVSLYQGTLLTLSSVISFDRRIDPDFFPFVPKVEPLTALHAAKACGHKLAQQIRSLITRTDLHLQNLRNGKSRIQSHKV